MIEPFPAPAVHGGAPAGFLDLSVNLNPLGTPPAVAAALAEVRYGSYADLDPTAATARLAADSGVDRARIVLTAGATEGLRLAVGRLLPRGGRMLVLGPTYGEYRRLGSLRSATVAEVRAAAPSFSVPVADAIQAIRATQPHLIVMCDPNNPTGQSVTGAGAAALLDAVGGAHVIVDESFAPFRSDDTMFPLDDDRLVLVRSLTKIHAVPGVRAGFVVASPALADDLLRLRDPWSVGSHALALAKAGGWALPSPARAAIAAWRKRLMDGLIRQRLEPLASTANFVMVRTTADAESFIAGLAAGSIAVRACNDFGLAAMVRIAVPDPAGLARLLAALDRCNAHHGRSG